MNVNLHERYSLAAKMNRPRLCVRGGRNGLKRSEGYSLEGVEVTGGETWSIAKELQRNARQNLNCYANLSESSQIRFLKTTEYSIVTFCDYKQKSSYLDI